VGRHGLAVAVRPPRRAFLRTGYTRIWEPSICMGFSRRESSLQVERWGTGLWDEPMAHKWNMATSFLTC
jgi:hypothetical protein